jgi:hypothetical protein
VIVRTQQRLDLPGCQNAWQFARSPASYARNRCNQRRLNEPLHVQESQQATQRSHLRFRRVDTGYHPGLSEHERDDGGGIQARQRLQALNPAQHGDPATRAA